MHHIAYFVPLLASLTGYSVCNLYYTFAHKPVPRYLLHWGLLNSLSILLPALAFTLALSQVH